MKSSDEAGDWPHLKLSKKWIQFLYVTRCSVPSKAGDIHLNKKRRYGDDTLLSGINKKGS